MLGGGVVDSGREEAVAEAESLESRVYERERVSRRFRLICSRQSRSGQQHQRDSRGPIPPSAAASSQSSESGTLHTSVEPVFTYSE